MSWYIFRTSKVFNSINQKSSNHLYRYFSSSSSSNNRGRMSNSIPFKELITKLNELTPLELAGSWDNVGLLVEPSSASKIQVQSIFLTNDLTEHVLEEAIEANASMIVSYHPPLFASFKKVTQGVIAQRIAIRAIEARIPIYSPHSALDAIKGGINDWISEGLLAMVPNTPGTYNKPIQATQLASSTSRYSHKVEITGLKESKSKLVQSIDSSLLVLDSNNNSNDTIQILVPQESKLSALVEVIESIKPTPIWSCQALQSKTPSTNVGQGRLVGLGENGVSIEQVIETVKKLFGLQHIRLGRPTNGQSKPIKSVALCAGSGASVILSSNADLYLTGELSHHEILDKCARGNYVIVCDHSNTERGYLEHYKKMILDKISTPIDIKISTRDRDPLEII